LSNRTYFRHEISFYAEKYDIFENQILLENFNLDIIKSDLKCRKLPPPLSNLYWGMTKEDISKDGTYENCTYIGEFTGFTTGKLNGYDFDVTFKFQGFLPEDADKDKSFYGLFSVSYSIDKKEGFDEEDYINVYKKMAKYCNEIFGRPIKRKFRLRNKIVYDYKPEFTAALRIGKLNLKYTWKLQNASVDLGLSKLDPEKGKPFLYLSIIYTGRCNKLRE
jgi:hypothetical protein